MPCAAVRVIHDQLIVPAQPAYGVPKGMEDEGNIIDLEVVGGDGHGVLLSPATIASDQPMIPHFRLDHLMTTAINAEVD
jgi:hypothetical protein